MPAISADTVALPRIPTVDPTAVERPVRSVTTAPSGFEGEGFPVRRAFAAGHWPLRVEVLPRYTTQPRLRCPRLVPANDRIGTSAMPRG